MTNLTTTNKFNFRFKKDDMGNKRAPVELDLPVPTAEGLLAIIAAGGKGLDLLNEAVYSVIKSVAGEIVSATLDISQDNFPMDRVQWDAIANMPASERVTISPEQWAAFAKDYAAIMPGLTSKTPEQVQLAVDVFLKKCLPARSNKKALGVLQTQLAIFADTPNAEQHAEVLNLLARRIDGYLKADDPALLAENL